MSDADSGTTIGRAFALPLELPGSLLILPVVILLAGSEWTLEARHEPAAAEIARHEAAEGPVSMPTYLVPEGSQVHPGIEVGWRDRVTFEVPPLRHEFLLGVQADRRNQYRVSVSADGAEFEPLWEVPPRGQRGIRTRTESFAAPERPIRYIRLAPSVPGANYKITGIRVDYTVAVVPHYWLIPVLWGLWLAVRAASPRLLRAWQAADPWLATALIVLVLFRLTAESLVLAASAVVVWLLVRTIAKYLKRSPLLTVVYLAFLGGLFFWLLPVTVGALAARSAGQRFDLSVDHRMRPDGREINADGLRFRGTGADLADEEFVVLVLGDSFTYGLGLSYEESYPYAMERLLADAECSAEVRTVNFGWSSSSPLLSLRLLREIGRGYRPDLVVYTLDMTDFHDDLRYAEELRQAGGLQVDYRRVALEITKIALAKVPLLAEVPDTLSRLRRRAREAPGEVASSLPANRFFVAARSLEETRADIERGVMANLAAIHAYSRDELAVPFAVVVYPRAFQYSTRETPRNWEGHRYDVLGPWSREVFRYLQEVEGELPYPVVNLLPAFEAADEFPLFFEDDPHWNAAGSRLAASAVARQLSESGLIPCPAA